MYNPKIFDPDQPLILEWPTNSHAKGGLTFCEFPTGLPFTPVRAYWIHDIPVSARRGGHAHRENYEVLVPVSGGLTARLYTPDRREMKYRLERPDAGIYIPPGWWREFDEYLAGTVCLVFSSGHYDENEYIRSADEFFKA